MRFPVSTTASDRTHVATIASEPALGNKASSGAGKKRIRKPPFNVGKTKARHQGGL
jgi:hypothetical protein